MSGSDLVSLKLVLDHLHCPASAATLADRKRLQKVIYLAQAAGLDLGYRFSWYLLGPYSAALTRDYFSLGPQVVAEAQGFKLTDQVVQELSTVEPLMQVPNDVQLNQSDWLELVASLLFLQRDSRHSREEAYRILERQKAHLHQYADSAQHALEEAGLL